MEIARRLIYVAFLAVLALSVPAFSQTVTQQATVSVTPVTLNTDGSPVKTPVSYDLYNGPKAGPFVLLQNVANVTCPVGFTPPTGEVCLTPVTISATNNCFTVVTVDGNGNKAPQVSNVACFTQPAGASGLTITVIVTVH